MGSITMANNHLLKLPLGSNKVTLVHNSLARASRVVVPTSRWVGGCPPSVHLQSRASELRGEQHPGLQQSGHLAPRMPFPPLHGSTFKIEALSYGSLNHSSPAKCLAHSSFSVNVCWAELISTLCASRNLSRFIGKNFTLN